MNRRAAEKSRVCHVPTSFLMGFLNADMSRKNPLACSTQDKGGGTVIDRS